ncbi:tetratricopeptide repeat protein [Granulibacter bethesdensis]|uniref:tetratricopeptide repeat protein n=1 Tax=Granulibacter bethesdensis TaxID=364410 RepID=UPI0003F1DA5E|nr:tetratricopeptide repeat protein [Granulibacter bethesdensis]AHJ64626.1 Thioredoxin [Granulibacter bethesdensis CGDNIH4]
MSLIIGAGGNSAGGAGASRRGPSVQGSGLVGASGQDVSSQNPATLSAQEMIIDGSQDTFMEDVIEASRTTPVLVDFWATWCGPCKQLTPALEKAVRAAQGRIKLVKIDIDQNRSLVQQLAQLGLPVQSVPTVAAFWQGQIADLFQGAVPESEIKRFVEALLKMTGGELPGADLLAEAKRATEAGEHEMAAQFYSALIQQDAEKPEGWAGLARSLLALDQPEEAAAVLDQAPPAIAAHADIEGARSAVAVAEEGRQARARLAELQAAHEANPDDRQAAYDLSAALSAAGEREQAAGLLLDIIRHDRAWNEDAARLQLLRFFDAWGQGDPATLAARRKLSALLFS